MYLGVDYYPEQWDPSLMEQDLENIRELGSNVVRIGEFCWEMMEPQEGVYDFSFFDHVIAKAAKAGLAVIFGTPTATFPAWMAKKYPEILSENTDGTKRSFGGRRQYCFNSGVYLKKSHDIVRALAQHYKNEKNIVAWQIDNEFGHEGSDECFCPCCEKAFHRWLEEKYSTIDKLDSAWGTVFWSQRYHSFGEVPVPKPTIAAHNPSLLFCWEKFRSDSVADYCSMQYRLLKEIMPDSVVFHDFSGGFLEKHFDFHQTAQHMDLVAYNHYPVWGGQPEPLPPEELAFNLDYIRGLKQKNFWITEAIMGAQGHRVIGCSPRPGQAKMWAFQAFAHGCESLLFFRYRGFNKGAEQFCYGVLDADNVKRRKFYEVKEFFGDVSANESVFRSSLQADVALLYDYDSMSSFRAQPQSSAIDYRQELLRWYRPFYKNNIAVDVLNHQEDFSQYRVLLAPVMIIAHEKLRLKLEQFVQNGGILLLTYRSFWKDGDNNLFFGQFCPANLGGICGMRVEESESLQTGQSVLVQGETIRGSGSVFREMIAPDTAETLLRYEDELYSQYSAATLNHYGKGKVYYIGTGLDEQTAQALCSRIEKEAGLKPAPAPEGVEVVRRQREGKPCRLVINHNPFTVSYEGQDLPAYGYHIITG